MHQGSKTSTSPPIFQPSASVLSQKPGEILLNNCSHPLPCLHQEKLRLQPYPATQPPKQLSTPDLSALPQTALHHLSSLAQKSSAGYNKLSASVQSKFHEAQDKIRTVEYSKLPAEAQAKLHSAQDRIRAVDLKSLPASAQSKF